MATELLALAAGQDSAGRILTASDRRNTEFLDVLIENEQKEVIAHTVVQRYLQVSRLFIVGVRSEYILFQYLWNLGTLARKTELGRLENITYVFRIYRLSSVMDSVYVALMAQL